MVVIWGQTDIWCKKSRSDWLRRRFYVLAGVQIGLYDPAEADMEHSWDSCIEGFLGERL